MRCIRRNGLRVLLSLLTSAAFWIAPLSSSTADELTEAERRFLGDHPTITFISQTHYPPFEFVGADGDHTGMSIELMRWIATELGFKALFVDAPFKEAQDSVLTGKADVLTSLFFSKKRDKIFDFSQVIFEVPASIFVKAERPDIQGIQDLQAKRIAMQSVDYAQEFLETKGIRSHVIYTQNFAEATDLVISGNADAIIGDEQIVLYHIFSRNLTDRIKKVGEPLYIGQNCLAAKEGSRLLVAILDKGINLANQKGALAQINRKWVGVHYGPSRSLLVIYLPHVMITAGFLLVIAVLIWFWNLNLRKKVAVRTGELAASEKTLRTILSSSPVGIGLLIKRTIGWHNQAMATMLGYAPGELEGRPVDILFRSPQDLQLAVDQLRGTRQRGISAVVETVLIRKDLTTFDCLLRYAPIYEESQESSAIVIAEDITARKGAEEALKLNKIHLEELYHRSRKSEERAKTILEANPDPMAVYDETGRPAYLNPAFTRVFGWGMDEIREQNIPFVPEDQKSLTETKIREIFANDKPILFQTKRLTKRGIVLDVVISAAVIKDSTGRVVETVVNFTDITALKRTESERLLLATALHQAAETILITDIEGRLLYANPAFEKTSGFAIEESLGRDVNFLRSDKQDSDIYRRLWEIISRGETWSGHLINKKKDGTLFEEEVTISPVRDDGGRIVNYVAVKRDVTRETQLEKQLRQAQKMEAIGTLAGGIAHDFNNILSAVMGFSELGLKRAVKGAPTEKEHREVMKAAERARDLIRHILTFSSKATIELSPLDLNSVVRHAMNMVERTIPKMINIRLNLAEKLSAINGNAGQLDQVLLNLCGNAADAMPDGGHLSVETRQITIRDGLCSATDKAFSGEFVLLEVSDTGQGMDDEVQGHIFDPFFTTKPVGKGTGLGLSTVFGIMQAHGGFITCQSRPDNGTLFGLYFPVSFAQIPSSETETLPPKESRKGKETILLVDDEAPLREIGQETLEYYGYRPLLAESGEEALAIYRECGSNIDLIILDISMPGMGGERCMKALLELNPMAKIIISSGYARDGQLDESLKARACAYLVKPYRFETLLTMVRSVLDNI